MSNDHPIRDAVPARSSVAARSNYAGYRPDLRNDFNKACGYCGAADERTDPIAFHIDHFAPQKLFPNLKTDYGNLVYACRFCNVSKSDHWVGDKANVPNNGSEGFVDPCAVDFDTHLGRDETGRIVAKTALGGYMVNKLSFDLLRHELLWRAGKARAMRDEIDDLLSKSAASGGDQSVYVTLLERFYQLTKLIERYELRALRP